MNLYCINAAWSSPVLKGPVLITALALAQCADDEFGECAPTLDHLLRLTHRTGRGRLKENLRQLEQLGFIERMSKGTGGRGEATKYRVRTEPVSSSEKGVECSTELEAFAC